MLTVGFITLGFFFRGEIVALLKDPSWFFLAVLLSELFFFPRITVLIASGLLFPPLTGAALTVAGDVTAAVLVWAAARNSLAMSLGTAILKHERTRWMRPLLRGNKAGIAITVLRILPFSHFSTVSLLSGTLKIPLAAFTLGTLLGCLPTALVYPFVAQGIVQWNPAKFIPAAALIVLTAALAILSLNRMRGPK
ncbi:VTT domain-containing protein [Myxococcota bacterium]|nr:VTT domain-containing protein [Myxococcota bacterium]